MNEIRNLVKSELDRIITECNLTKEQELILRMVNRGESISHISIEMNLSESTVNRRLKEVRIRMDKAIDNVPIWEKSLLTVRETAKYTNIGEKKIRELSDNPYCDFVIRVGKKVLIKRKQFEKFLETAEEL